jgi:hypothetical protein
MRRVYTLVVLFSPPLARTKPQTEWLGIHDYDGMASMVHGPQRQQETQSGCTYKVRSHFYLTPTNYAHFRTMRRAMRALLEPHPHPHPSLTKYEMEGLTRHITTPPWHKMC